MNSSKSLSAEGISEIFSIKSATFNQVSGNLRKLWTKYSQKRIFDEDLESWKNDLKYRYDIELFKNEKLFLNQLYLVMFTKICLYLRINELTTIGLSNPLDILKGNYLKEVSLGIDFEDLLNPDPSKWLLRDQFRDHTKKSIEFLLKRLEKYSFSQVDEDIFLKIYEELIYQEDRITTGEYYTPKWIANLLIDRVFSLKNVNDRHEIPKILDPSSGSGIFLFYLIKKLLKMGCSTKKITKTIVGYELNPLACFIARVNYILALYDNKIESIDQIPIYNRDSLSPPNLLIYNTLKERYGIILGNPPWIVMRSIKNKKYQDFLKKEVLKYKLLDTSDVHLFSQIEMAALFFRKSVHKFLKTDGIIGFVMPRSVIGGTMQHINFRKFDYPKLKLLEIIDLGDVKPVFNMPACLLIGLNKGKTEYPVLSYKYSGELDNRNVSLADVGNQLSITPFQYYPPKLSNENNSFYYDKFQVGASIFPKAFYFVKILSEEQSNYNFRTSPATLKKSKRPWKVNYKGKIEKKFLFCTLSATEIIPFGCNKLDLIVLPIERNKQNYKTLTVENLRDLDCSNAKKWLDFIEKTWENRRTEKSASRFPSILDRLDYNALLTKQKFNKQYIVAYNATGKNITCCVLDRKSSIKLELDKHKIEIQDILMDVKTWYYTTEDEYEAHYLCAILNSPILNKKIKPLQPKGLGGAMAIHRRPLMFKIPSFDINNKLHITLSSIGTSCCQKIENELKKRNKITRSDVKDLLQVELHEIDNLVNNLIETG
ncbi:MAG: N-6 DNA methylase [Candidatus Lokiarchaeota archaeon]|nr:N-6 DNA methylase [Candidatus Lokiarchaeota archaeon]